jgi:hypothetical protein
MTFPTHRISYQVEYNILEQALNDELGARVRMPSIEAATHLRARIHQARKIDRDENREAFDEGHPMHGQSIYDKLVCRLKQVKGNHYLYVEQRNAQNFEIEPLTREDAHNNLPMEPGEFLVVAPLKRRNF